MKKEELKIMLEDFWYDSQYLKEKTKEVEKVTQMMMKNSHLQILQSAKQHDERQVFKIIEQKKYIEELISKLCQPYRIIMYLKYISFLTFDQIADQINYSTKRIYQLHSEAFVKLLEIANQQSQQA